VVTESYTPGAHLFEYLVPNCPTIRDVLERVDRYHQLIMQAVCTRVAVEGAEAAWTLQLVDGLPAPAVVVDLVLGVAVLQTRRLTGWQLPSLEVLLRRPCPRDVSRYQHVFGARVQFGASFDQIRFPSVGLDVRLPLADPVLARVLERAASDLLQKQGTPDDLLAQVRAVLADQLAGGDLQIERTAEVLGTSSRTLRRRLKELGTTHHTLLDEVRLARAEHYLRERRASVDEIAFLLGFSDAPSFHRAFRRWTGKTPAQVRRGP